MPLTAYMNERVAQVRAFLADPDAVLLEIRGADEQIPAITKMVIGIGDHDDSEDVMVGADGAFDGDDDLCEVLHQTLQEAGEQAQAMFESKQLSLVLPPAPASAPPHPDPVPQHRVAEHAERLALVLAPFVRNLVIVLRATLEHDSAGFAAQLGRICEALEGGCVKLILIRDEQEALVREVAISRPRHRAYTLAPASGARDVQLRELMAEPLARVLTYDAPARGQTWMKGQFAQLGVDGRTWLATFEGLRWFDQAIAFYGQGLTQVVEQLHTQAERAGRGKASAPLLERARVPQGERDAERYFVLRLHEYIDAVLEPTERMVVLLCPAVEDGVPDGEWESMAVSVRRLARALVTPRLKFVVVAPNLPGPDPQAGGKALHVQRFRMDDKVIEKGLRDKLAQPDLSPLVRLRCTSALAGFAMGRGNPEEGMELSMDALDQASDMDDPVETGVAFYGVGNALYRCAALDKAVDAYTRALDIAVEHDSAVLAAQSVTGMGNGHFVIGQFDRAIECYEIACTYYRKLSNPLMEAYVLTWLGESHAKSGHVQPAEEAFRGAVKCCDDAEPRLGEAARCSKSDALQRMARFYRGQGLESLSREHHEQARALGPVAPLADEP